MKKNNHVFIFLFFTTFLFAEKPFLRLIGPEIPNNNYHVEFDGIDKEKFLTDLQAGHSSIIIFQLEFAIDHKNSVKEFIQTRESQIIVEKLAKWDFFSKEFICIINKEEKLVFKESRPFLHCFFQLDYASVNPGTSFSDSKLRVLFWPKRLLEPLFILDLLGILSPKKTSWMHLPRMENFDD